MLNKKNRIRNRKVTEKLFKEGQLFKSRFFIIKYEKTLENNSSFAVSVSTKIHKKAVKRNHLKRQIYEAIRINLKGLKKNFIALVIARPAITKYKTSYKDLSEEINKFFNLIRLDAK